MTRRTKIIDLFVSALCAGLAAYALRGAAAIRHTIMGNEPGPAFFPRLMACILILLAAALAGRTFFSPADGGQAASPAPAGGRRFIPPVAGIAVLFVYIAVLEPLGFIVASALLALAFLLLCGVRRRHVLVAYPLVSSFAIYYVFRKLLVIFLPEGIFHF